MSGFGRLTMNGFGRLTINGQDNVIPLILSLSKDEHIIQGISGTRYRVRSGLHHYTV